MNPLKIVFFFSSKSGFRKYSKLKFYFWRYLLNTLKNGLNILYLFYFFSVYTYSIKIECSSISHSNNNIFFPTFSIAPLFQFFSESTHNFDSLPSLSLSSMQHLRTAARRRFSAHTSSAAYISVQLTHIPQLAPRRWSAFNLYSSQRRPLVPRSGDKSAVRASASKNTLQSFEEKLLNSYFSIWYNYFSVYISKFPFNHLRRPKYIYLFDNSIFLDCFLK